MPLVLWLGSVFTGLVAFFAEYLTKRFAIVAALITVFIAISGSFMIAIEEAIASITAAFPVGAIGFGMSLMPSNVPACLTAMLSAHVAAVFYSMYKNFNAIQGAQTVR